MTRATTGRGLMNKMRDRNLKIVVGSEDSDDEKARQRLILTMKMLNMVLSEKHPRESLFYKVTVIGEKTV